MEEKETKEVQEELETQTVFNTDSLDELVNGEDCTVENKEEVETDANENK